jgi:SRSO17 transposase
MSYEMDGAAQERLQQYFDLIGTALEEPRRRASYAMYAMGLFGDGDRKSMEPIAAKACGSTKDIDALHQRLGHFITDSKWSDSAVRRTAARYAIDEMVKHGPIEAWIIDDTGFLKQGKHSVGVKRQCTGSAGKITNCQIGVSLSVSTRTEHVPIDFELYLPKEWVEGPGQRKEARIPEQVQFATKPELALKMVDRALKDKVPKGVVLADEGYGNNGAFRAGVRARGLHYAVAINSSTTVWVVDPEGSRGLVKWTPKEIAKALGKKRFRRTTWREGTRERLSAKFALKRVVVGHDDGHPPSEREEQWLLMEWRDGEDEPAHFYLLTLAKETSRKLMVRLVKERYRTERAYEDLKNELGLDHFEGRRFSGWHHHVSVVLSCYAFIVAEKCRAFFPSEGCKGDASPLRPTAGAPLRGFVHHIPLGDRAHPEHLAPSVSALPPSPNPSALPCLTQAPVGLTQ